jgi:hypothetical protein
VFPVVVGVVFEIFYGSAKKCYQNSNTKRFAKKVKELKNSNEDGINYFEHPNYEQHTSVPEKQIEDIEQ